MGKLLADLKALIVAWVKPKPKNSFRASSYSDFDPITGEIVIVLIGDKT